MTQLVNVETGEIVSASKFLPARGELSPVSLSLPPDLSFDEWQDYGARLTRMAEGVMWWLGDWWNYGERKYGEAASQAAPTGYAVESLRAAAWVSQRVESVSRLTDLSWSHHQAVAALEPAEQNTFLAKAVEHGWSRQDLRQAVRLFNTALRIGKHANEADALADSGVYQVLYVDPPWQYEYAESSTRAIENNYPTMKLDEIKALEVPAAPDAVLFLWATSPKLSESIEVMEAWGFEYRTCMVWVKDQIGMGYYARQRHELLLIGKRGELPVPPPSDRPDSVVEAPRAEHSAKPERFAELIEDMYPGFSKAELFCRGEPRDGWYGWGNQTVNAVNA